MVKVLVTGCSGALGSGIAKNLLDLNFVVYGISNVKPCKISHPNHFCKQIDLLTADFDSLMDSTKPDVLVHTAWVTEHQVFWNSDLNKEWRNRTIELAKSFYRNSGTYFLGIGSSAEYSDQIGEPLTVGMHESPSSIYGQYKLDTLNALHNLGAGFGWARVFYQYSLDHAEKKLIPTLYRSALSGTQLTLRNPLSEYDFVYRGDVITNLATLITSQHQGVVNLGSGQCVSVKAVASYIELMTGKELFTFPEDIEHPAVRIVADIQENRELGFYWSSVFDVLSPPHLWA
jgi:nucleoside-diphosphate-sugar epimerase